jgi:hypothetical protein
MIEWLDWNAYNEAGDLKEAVERYKVRDSFYPERILADKICRNRNNLQYCDKLKIRMNGPKLGRPPSDKGSVPSRNVWSCWKLVNGTQLRVNSVKANGATV